MRGSLSEAISRSANSWPSMFDDREWIRGVEKNFVATAKSFGGSKVKMVPGEELHSIIMKRNYHKNLENWQAPD